MSADDPTPGEIWRRMEQVSQQLADIASRLERRDTYIEENFVRSRVWIEARKADQAATANLQQDIGALQTQQETDRNWRRTANLTIAVALIGNLLTIAGLVISIVSR